MSALVTKKLVDMTFTSDQEAAAWLEELKPVEVYEDEAGINAGASTTCNDRRHTMLSWTQLRRLAPVSLKTVRKQSESGRRLMMALYLIGAYFPQEMRRHISSDVTLMTDGGKWVELMFKFYEYIEREDYFKVDWPLLAQVRDIWLETGSSDSVTLLSLFLTHIPFVPFGFTFHDVFDHPVIKILTNFFVKLPDGIEMPVPAMIGQPLLPVTLPSDYTEEVWTVPRQDQALSRLQMIVDDPDAWPEPVRQLPDYVRWAVVQSDNVILGTSGDPEYPWPWQVLEEPDCWFTFADHFSRVCEDWQEAKPIIISMKRFLKWCESGENLGWLIDFILYGGGSPPDQDWGVL